MTGNPEDQKLDRVADEGRSKADYVVGNRREADADLAALFDHRSQNQNLILYNRLRHQNSGRKEVLVECFHENVDQPDPGGVT